MRAIPLRFSNPEPGLTIVVAYVDEDDRFVYYATQTKKPGWKTLYHIYRIETEEGIGGRRAVPSDLDIDTSSDLLYNWWTDDDFSAVLDNLVKSIRWEIEEGAVRARLRNLEASA